MLGRRNKEIMPSRELAPTPSWGGAYVFAQPRGLYPGGGSQGLLGRESGLQSQGCYRLLVTPGRLLPSLGLTFPTCQVKVPLTPLPSSCQGARSWVGCQQGRTPLAGPAECLLSIWTGSGLESLALSLCGLRRVAEPL